MTRCNDVLEHLYEYLNCHDLTGDQETMIRRHLDECRHCFSRFQFERLLLDRIKKKGCCCSCPETLKNKVKDILKHF